MKKTFSKRINFAILTVFLLVLTLTLTGCGLFNQEPEAIIITEPQPKSDTGVVEVPVNSEIHFDGGSSEDPDGTINSYAWDFGDGNSDSGKTTEKSYSSAGTYTVSLTVSDNHGATDTTEITVQVVGLPPPPE